MTMRACYRVGLPLLAAGLIVLWLSHRNHWGFGPVAGIGLIVIALASFLSGRVEDWLEGFWDDDSDGDGSLFSWGGDSSSDGGDGGGGD